MIIDTSCSVFYLFKLDNLKMIFCRGSILTVIMLFTSPPDEKNIHMISFFVVSCVMNCMYFVCFRIRASVRLTVYCSAIRHGGTEEWDFAYRMYKQSNVASEQSRLMLAMSCSSKVWVLGR